ncbi:xylose isomerase-like [Aristolochia californica]|uniref:xylose isomerase-like n=1 Tax=Aristolochia californica TaxID=171875 RepID=UPI0035DB6A1D
MRWRDLNEIDLRIKEGQKLPQILDQNKFFRALMWLRGAEEQQCCSKIVDEGSLFVKQRNNAQVLEFQIGDMQFELNFFGECRDPLENWECKIFSIAEFFCEGLYFAVDEHSHCAWGRYSIDKAAVQVKTAMEVTHYLGGQNYVFWGGREGYQSLLHTDMKRELDHMATFLKIAADWKQKIGFIGTLLIGTKPQEPTMHQYEWDAATPASFLLKYGLSGEFEPNSECNHATLSKHNCFHELEIARISGLLSNIDANIGDPQNCWDTIQFLVDIGEATLIMLCVVRKGGLPLGGFNFDAKLRKEITDPKYLFIAHISRMDTLARGLHSIAKLIDEGELDELGQNRDVHLEKREIYSRRRCVT